MPSPPLPAAGLAPCMGMLKSLGPGGSPGQPWDQVSCGRSLHPCSRTGGQWGRVKQLLQLPHGGRQAENTPGDQRTRGKGRGSPRRTGDPLVLKSQQGWLKGRTPVCPISPSPPQGQPHKQHLSVRPAARPGPDAASTCPTPGTAGPDLPGGGSGHGAPSSWVLLGCWEPCCQGHLTATLG